MSLKTVVGFIREGALVHLFNNSGATRIYYLKSVTPTNTKSCDVSSPFGNLLDDDEWLWYIKNEFGDDLVEQTEIPADILNMLPIEHYAQTKPSGGSE